MEVPRSPLKFLKPEDNPLRRARPKFRLSQRISQYQVMIPPQAIAALQGSHHQPMINEAQELIQYMTNRARTKRRRRRPSQTFAGMFQVSDPSSSSSSEEELDQHVLEEELEVPEPREASLLHHSLAPPTQSPDLKDDIDDQEDDDMQEEEESEEEEDNNMQEEEESEEEDDMQDEEMVDATGLIVQQSQEKSKTQVDVDEEKNDKSEDEEDEKDITNIALRTETSSSEEEQSLEEEVHDDNSIQTKKNTANNSRRLSLRSQGSPTAAHETSVQEEQNSVRKNQSLHEKDASVRSSTSRRSSRGKNASVLDSQEVPEQQVNSVRQEKEDSVVEPRVSLSKRKSTPQDRKASFREDQVSIPEEEKIVEEVHEEANEQENQAPEQQENVVSVKPKQVRKKKNRAVAEEPANPVEESNRRYPQRNRVPCLEYWKGERVKYKRDSTGLAWRVDGIIPAKVEVKKDRKRLVKKRRHDVLDHNSNPFDLSVHANNIEGLLQEDKKRKRRIMKQEHTIGCLNSANWIPSKNVGVERAVLMNEKGKGHGFIKMAPFSCKTRQKTVDYWTSFTVIRGALQITVDDNAPTFFKSGQFLELKPHTYYSIDNLRKDTAYIKFDVLRSYTDSSSKH